MVGAADLTSLLDEAGARRADVEGSSLVIDFGSVEGEFAAMQAEVGVCDLGPRGLLSITGADRASWLHGLCTQNIRDLELLGGAYACHIDIKGRIQADFRVLVLDDFLLLDTEPSMGRTLRRMLKRYIVMEDVKLRDRDHVLGTLGLLGPAASALLGRLGGHVAELPTHHASMVELRDGSEVLVVATDQFGVPGFRLVAHHDDLVDVWRLLAGAGARPVGHRARELSRIRAGRPRFGAELDETVLFNEAELHDAVSFTKGCYLGQEVVERVDARGRVGRRLLGLVLDCGDGDLPAVGATIRNEKRKLGSVTSVARLPDSGREVALGFIHRADNQPGTVLLVDRESTSPASARVVERSELAAT